MAVGSEVARLRERIANEFMAAKWGLTGLTYGTPKHQFITARMEQMGQGQEKLADIIGSEQSIALVAETLFSLPEQPQRGHVLHVIRQLRGDTEHTEHILDWIEDVWETLDVLVQEFGVEDAKKILFAPASRALFPDSSESSYA